MSLRGSTFELENVGAGTSPFRLEEPLSNPDTHAVVLLLQRDYHCRNCRQQVQDVATRYDAFEAENALVVSVLPEPVDRARNREESYDLPFPLLADPEKELGDDLDRPSGFGVLGNLHDVVGRMPEALVVDVLGDDPTVTDVHEGTSPSDRRATGGGPAALVAGLAVAEGCVQAPQADEGEHPLLDGGIEAEGTYSHPFETAGEYRYFPILHERMGCGAPSRWSDACRGSASLPFLHIGGERLDPGDHEG